MNLSPSGAEPEPQSAAAGQRWFEEEARPHELALRAHLRRRFPTLGDVDDVVQESFLRAFLAWQRGQLKSVKGFLFSVAGNLTISGFRRRKFVTALPVNESAELSVLTEDAGVFEQVCSQEELTLIAEAIAELPVRCREVATRRILHGSDYRTIARELGMSEQTVRVQMARAMKKCVEYFRARGFGEEPRS